MSISGLSEQELLELQKRFQQGKLKKNEVTEEEIKDLKELYKIQILELEESIEKDRKKILDFLKGKK